MTAKIEANGVTVRAGEKEILHRITTIIPGNHVFTIVGPSGAGKSTFLRTINRLVEMDSGEIMLDGGSIRDLEPVELRRRVGMVFQIPLPFEGTVEDNLLMGPMLNGSPEPDVGDLLDMVGLGDAFAGRKASELSVGEQQRMCIARAIANGPEVLLMDEPTASLDLESAGKVENLILNLRESGDLTLVIVTHDMDQGRRIGDWTMLMRDGRSMGTMETAEFFERHRGVIG